MTETRLPSWRVARASRPCVAGASCPCSCSLWAAQRAQGGFGTQGQGAPHADFCIGEPHDARATEAATSEGAFRIFRFWLFVLVDIPAKTGSDLEFGAWDFPASGCFFLLPLTPFMILNEAAKKCLAVPAGRTSLVRSRGVGQSCQSGCRAKRDRRGQDSVAIPVITAGTILCRFQSRLCR